MRSQLADRWRDYVGKYGPINRVTLRPTGRTDPDTGETIQARITPAAVRALRSDPSAALLWGLEVFDEAAGTAEPAALLRQRVVVTRQPVRGVDNAFDGLSVVLDTMGAVDLDAISHLTGTDVDTVVAELGDAIYQLPGTDSWQTREYLSGNVRKKLHQARVADLETPGHWQRNIDALQTVMPADLQAGDLSPRIGAVWISAEDHQQFLRDTLDLPRVRVDHVPGVGRAVENGSWGVKATEEWGTPRLDAGSIFEHLARQRPIAIFDTDPDKKRIYNPVASAAAIEKGRLLQERCDPWVLSLLLAVMGLCCAPAIAAAAEAISHAVPEARRGDAMGWQGTFSTLGNAVAPPFVGFAIDHGGWQQGFWVAGMGGAVAVGIAAALLAFGRRRAARAVV